MSIQAFTAFRVECDLCGFEVPGDGGTPWYGSVDEALLDLDAWGWHWVGTMHTCYPECHDPCFECERVHGAHDINCEIICDEVDDWIAALLAEGEA